jgi:hypothetical protein
LLFSLDPNKTIDATVAENPTIAFTQFIEKRISSRAKPFSSSSRIIPTSPCKSENTWQERFSRDYSVQRNLNRAASLPYPKSLSSVRFRNRVLDIYEPSSNNSTISLPNTNLAESSNLPDIPLFKRPSGSNNAKNPVAALVKARIKRENIRRFIEDCVALSHGVWRKVKRRDIGVIVDKSMSVFEHDESGTLSQNELRMQLAAELATCPETYAVLAEILDENQGPELSHEDESLENAVNEDNMRILSKLTSCINDNGSSVDMEAEP